jgi:DNA-directed RNA polymerase
MDTAEKPLEGKKWWLKADDPWQCLAACFELSAALKSGDPVSFMSRLPIHQDGTCNGLQHYAALGGDILGARQVNLLPSDKPQDIYSSIAQQVQEMVLKDANENKKEALLMKNLVNRKLVKQTVMTNTYGVTFIGAKKQVANRIREARSAEVKDAVSLTDQDIASCSNYIAKKIFESMGHLFEGAREIQNWLNSAAVLISKSIPADDLPEEDLALANELKKLGLLENSSKPEFTLSDPLLDSVLMDENDKDSDLGTDEATVEGEEDQESMINLVNRPALIIQSSKKNPVKMASVIWTTPLGLPVVQPYRVFKSTCVRICVRNHLG